MTAEEFQTAVLQQLQVLQQNFTKLDTRMDDLQLKMGSLDSRVNTLALQLDKLDSRADELETNLTHHLAAQYSIMNAKLDECLAIQQNDLMKLLEIIHEEMATQEETDRIVKAQAEQSKMLSLLSTRSIQHEAELEYLKLAK